jgi:hypothetical protein
MKVTYTAREIMDKGRWDEVCKLFGYNPWCVNEGTMSSDCEIEFTEEQARKVGLLNE